MSRCYFDHNATAPLLPEARAAMQAFFDEPGNPSSLHAEGRRARQALELARDRVAALVGARREQIVFTSGGTEANGWAVTALAEQARAQAAGRRRVLVSAIEHPSVLESCRALAARGFVVEVIGVDGEGRLDEAALAARLDDDVALVTVQRANHELGVLQDVARIAARARAAGARVHADAVQALGKIAVDAAALGVDALTLSAHKIGGPKGVGALVLPRADDLPALLHGGHQERERRPGTENALGIVGFGAAAEATGRALAAEGGDAGGPGALRDRFERGALALGARVHGAGAARVPTTSNVAFAGVDGELLMEALDLDGFAVSTGAACSSGTRQPSPVIRAIGQDAKLALRVSFGRGNRVEEVDRLLARLPALLERIRDA